MFGVIMFVFRRELKRNLKTIFQNEINYFILFGDYRNKNGPEFFYIL